MSRFELVGSVFFIVSNSLVWWVVYTICLYGLFIQSIVSQTTLPEKELMITLPKIAKQAYTDNSTETPETVATTITGKDSCTGLATVKTTVSEAPTFPLSPRA